MRKTWDRFKRLADRCRIVFAIMGIALASSLLTFGAASWYMDKTLKAQTARSDEEIDWLKGELSYERDITRKTLGELTGQVEYVISRLGPMTNTLESAAGTAKSASTTAGRAAATIQELVTSPELPAIRETVIPAPRPKPEQKDVPEWLGGG